MKINPAQHAQICDLYFERGLSQPQIAKQYNCSHACIGKILKKSGKECRIAGGTLTLDEHDRRKSYVATNLKAGMTINEIATNLSITTTSLKEFIDRNKLDGSGIQIPSLIVNQPVNIEYIKAAIVTTDHGDCGCTQCQANLRILNSSVSEQTQTIATLVQTTIRKYRQCEEESIASDNVEYAQFLLEESVGSNNYRPIPTAIIKDCPAPNLGTESEDLDIGSTIGLWTILRRVWRNRYTLEFSATKETIPIDSISPSRWVECKCQGCGIVKGVSVKSLRTGKSRGCRKCMTKNIVRKKRNLSEYQNKKLALTIEQVIELREDGKTLKEIAVIAEVSKQRLSQLTRGYERTKNTSKIKQIIDDFASDLATSEIAKTHKLTVGQIYNIWIKAGLSAKDRTKKLGEIDESYGLWKVGQRVWVDKKTKVYSFDKNEIQADNRAIVTFLECECQGCGVKKAVCVNNLRNGKSRACLKCACKNRKK
jgi:transcriptional regulator